MGCICRRPMTSTIRYLRLVRSKDVVLSSRGARSPSNRKTLGQRIKLCRRSSSGVSLDWDHGIDFVHVVEVHAVEPVSRTGWKYWIRENVLSFQHTPKPGAERKLSTTGGAWQKIHGKQQSFCGCSAWRMASPDHYCAAEWNTVSAYCFHRQGEYRRRKPATEHKPCRWITHFPQVLVELV